MEIQRTTDGDRTLCVIDNALDQNQLAILQDYIDNEFTIDYASSNIVTWDKRLIDSISGTVDIIRLDQLMYPDIYDVCLQLVNSVSDIKCTMNRIRAQYYMGNNHSGINWHDDGTYAGAISLYLNDEWSERYGGLFQYTMDGVDIHTVVPTYNKAVFQSGGVDHKVTPVVEGSPIRRSLQIWINR